MSKEIKVTKCADCPFFYEDDYNYWCNILKDTIVEKIIIPEDCPLKTEPITVTL